METKRTPRLRRTLVLLLALVALVAASCSGRSEDTGGGGGSGSAGAIVASSWRTSMPTGHHVMQRPQPTHPDCPNWSHHDANLWVSHCR